LGPVVGRSIAPGAGLAIRHHEVGRPDRRPRQRGPDSILVGHLALELVESSLWKYLRPPVALSRCKPNKLALERVDATCAMNATLEAPPKTAASWSISSLGSFDRMTNQEKSSRTQIVWAYPPGSMPSKTTPTGRTTTRQRRASRPALVTMTESSSKLAGATTSSR
jgi:hypothetical protein